MRKKYFIPVLLVTAALALTACESDEVVTTEEVTEATTEETASTPVKKERAKITVSGIPEEMLKVGDEFTLSAEGAENYTFRSYNEDVATVDANGVVKVVSTGSFRIRVDAKGAMYEMVSLYVPTEEEVKAMEELKEEEPATEEAKQQEVQQTTQAETPSYEASEPATEAPAPQDSGTGPAANLFSSGRPYGTPGWTNDENGNPIPESYIYFDNYGYAYGPDGSYLGWNRNDW